ncbi:tripartite tricarboxylate transporter permease [Jannaschia sp. LMIT008]|uniref:tripartite tricarboxylate transporter permease n=1 Tax=Jannaschia maritima TaxID=3032585 RepID=UPI0028117BEC|nr:tripartite tricarboxylate transporter permease [Jannaschia sp. LMIT008]
MIEAVLTHVTLGAALAILIGTLLGIVVGGLPGLGSVVGLTICLPFTFTIETGPAIFLLLAVYCGSVYGGSISAILINTPGTPQAAATTLDGYPMAERGEGGAALGWATAASVAGGLLSCLVLILAAPQLARVAVRFGSIEVFALIVMALTCIAAVSQGSMLKGLTMGAFGLFLALIGTDPVVGMPRFDFGVFDLSAGLDLIAAVIGLFALSEALERARLGEGTVAAVRSVRIRLPGLGQWRGRLGGLLRSSGIGCGVGALPGTGAATAAFIAYALARQTSPRGGAFGTGEPDGIVAAESSNNAVTGSAMIPTLALGIPGDVVTAILLNALIIHGVTPGVRLMADDAPLVYAIFAALIVVNLVMLLMAFPVVRLFGWLLRIPERFILAAVIVLSLLGAAAVRGNPFDVLVAVLFGLLGFALRRGGYPLAPLVIGLVLGPQLEKTFRRGLLLKGDDFGAFFTHSPIATGIFALTALLLLAPLVRRLWAARRSGGAA